MEQAFIHRNTPTVRFHRSPERSRNGHPAAGALLQSIDSGAVYWHSPERRMEEGRTGSDENHGSTKVSVRCFVEIAVWLPLMLVQISSLMMGSNYYAECPRLPVLPLVMIFMGVTGIVFMVYALFSFGGSNSYGLKGKGRKSIQVYSMTSGVFWIIETTQYFIPVSFDPSSAEYCNVVFYGYSIFWNTLTIFMTATGFLLLHFIPDRPTVCRPTPRATLELQQWEGRVRDNNNYLTNGHMV